MAALSFSSRVLILACKLAIVSRCWAIVASRAFTSFSRFAMVLARVAI